MRLKSLVCALVVMAVPMSAVAEQEASTSKKSDDPREVGEWTYGIKGGLTLGMMNGTWVDSRTPDDNDSASLHQGVALGGFATYYLSSTLSIQPEFYMIEKGVDLNDGDLETTRDEGLLYLEVPVLAKYSFPINDMIHAYGVGGVTFGYLIDAKLNDREELKKFAIGGVVGLGGDIKLGSNLIIVEFRFNEGFLNTLDLQSEGDGDLKARNRVISFLLGFST